MATTEHDYYDVLGVARDADEREIKRAFRHKARELHPDVSNAPDADERFRALVEAYEVLSKPETRSLYDRFGHSGLRSGGFRPTHFDLGDLTDLFSAFFGDDLFGVSRPRRRRGADVAAEVEIDLVEAARGTRREVRFPVQVPCAACSGTGVEPGTQPTRCRSCDGAGRLQQVHRSALGQFVHTQTCPVCGGAGQVVEHPCSACRGRARVGEERELEIEIPPGIDDGQRIRISGEGHAGLLGGAAGDIYVSVHVRTDRRFAREGNDVYSTVDLTMTQAAVGARVTVPTLDGDVELDFRSGTQPGEVRVLRNRGIPVLQGFGRGDHHVIVNVAIPRNLTPEQRRLLEQFEEAVGPDTYRDDASLFDKLKSAFR
jgi:molecular chaperone DnaJ